MWYVLKRMQGNGHEIIQKISGLLPRAVLCVGKGFSREEWKALCFQQDKSLVQDAIQSTRQVAESFVPESKDRVLEEFSRIELLRQAFKTPEVQAACPTLSVLRLRSRFFENLDRALQHGRLLFAHQAESVVLEERLQERMGRDPRREEMFLLNRYWERLLEVREVWDEARLYEVAIDHLQNDDLKPGSSRLDREYFKLELYPDPPRVQLFWEEFSKRFSLIRVKAEGILESSRSPDHKISLQHKEAHFLEDAAHFLMDEILSEAAELSLHHVVIPDIPSIRRTLKRVAEARGVPLQDPRDPTAVIQSEAIKTALLEFELVAKNFPADLALSWIQSTSKNADHRKKIIERGVSSGIENYSFLLEISNAFARLKKQYPARCSLPELKEALSLSFTELKLESWIGQFFNRLFDEWTQSLVLIELENRKRPLRYWFEQVQERIKKLPPVLSPLRHEKGLIIQRADQAPSATLLFNEKASGVQVHFFGIGPSFFEVKERGSEWFSTRELDVLSSEFGIPSFRDDEKVLLQTYVNWASVPNAKFTEWTYEYDESGLEVEALDLSTLELPTPIEYSERIALGMHPVHEKSAFSKLKSHEPMLPQVLSGTQYPVSFLNAYGSCPFTAYSQYVLKLYDERETDYELAGDSYGNLVHASLEKILRESLSPEDAFAAAWATLKPQGWIKSDRMFNAMKHSVLKLLENFLVSELEYQARSHAKPILFEKEISWESEGIKFVGRVDRIDQHPEGLVVMDYKTSATVPAGQITLEKGIGLQLPLYSLALQKELDQAVISAQYVTLNEEKTNRNSGFLFSQWNKGKAADQVEFPISTARSNSKSILTEAPAEVWAKVDLQIKALAQSIQAGKFAPIPAEPKDCERCRYALTCGRRRFSSSDAAENESTN